MRLRGPTKEEELQELQRRYALLGSCACELACVA